MPRGSGWSRSGVRDRWSVHHDNTTLNNSSMRQHFIDTSHRPVQDWNLYQPNLLEQQGHDPRGYRAFENVYAYQGGGPPQPPTMYQSYTPIQQAPMYQDGMPTHYPHQQYQHGGPVQPLPPTHPAEGTSLYHPLPHGFQVGGVPLPPPPYPTFSAGVPFPQNPPHQLDPAKYCINITSYNSNRRSEGPPIEGQLIKWIDCNRFPLPESLTSTDRLGKAPECWLPFWVMKQNREAYERHLMEIVGYMRSHEPLGTYSVHAACWDGRWQGAAIARRLSVDLRYDFGLNAKVKYLDQDGKSDD